jgi:hypothetical protein
MRVLEEGDFTAIPLQMQQNGNRGRRGSTKICPAPASGSRASRLGSLIRPSGSKEEFT